ncbi:MAG TPA: heavy-metal-associated domain-containing protein [Chloroflexota bacterium]|nr:heavy-metal-associated domain-containing protein [Chloroflexota bacterium]HUM71434.1 heavy-metal-associated domain-containing protein [Chloroflexota bacterium]
MNTISLPLPMMYADHHVLAVRRLLLDLPGVADVYASSSFQTAEVTFDETQLDEEKIRSVLAQAGYMAELPVAVEFGSSQAFENGKPFFRHTAVFPQTDRTITFAQDVPEMVRPLWPCPGLEK